jgi:asparagine synthase (glutamine-hydrolysing)
MCGLAGFLGGAWAGAEHAASILSGMSGAIHHRGPDNSGQWIDAEHRVALAHQRLAIVDLSSAGFQPMLSLSGRYVTVYNGEIYNHLEIRSELLRHGVGINWRGHSDTETLLAAIEAWGVKTALEKVRGMFAFALWDRQLKQLILARDRMGEKPLYYGWQGRGQEKSFLFGSELKALVRHPAFAGEIDRGALALYMRHNCVPSPYSIYRDIHKLPPGHFAVLGEGEREPELHQYWSAIDVANEGARHQLQSTPEEAVDQLETLLLSAVGDQMMADVPLGAFLSGGIDSSTIAALMQARSSRPVKTFSIGVHEKAYNEAEHAKAVARHLGTDHTELYVTPEEALDVIPKLPSMYDEPFADSSQIPTFLVAQLARQHVTVSLSGDAGDELFAGYNRYKFTGQYWQMLSAIPGVLRSPLARAMTGISPDALNSLFARINSILPGGRRIPIGGEQFHKGASVLASRSVADLYKGLVSHWRDPSSIVIGPGEPPTALTGNAPLMEGLSPIERMMALDQITYLPDDILVKVDRAAMAVSLETRVPFLDHRVVEFASRLPLNLKLRDGQTKWALRQVLYRHVPQKLVDKPKMGFGIPIADWLRGPLKEWGEELLDPSKLRGQGYLHPEPIRKLWQAHQRGEVSAAHHLWDVMMFQAWLEARPDAAAN